MLGTASLLPTLGTLEPIFHSAKYYSHDYSYTRGNRICPMVQVKKDQHMLGLEALHKQQHRQ
jgi:hypothetical protein